MMRLLPFPIMAAALLAIWLLLNQSLSVGHVILGSAIAVLGSLTLTRLALPPLKMRRPSVFLGLVVRVTADVIRSNFAVVLLLLRPGEGRRRSGFMTVPLELRDPYGIALLAAIISSTPGTIVWVRFNRTRGLLLIHVFDLVDEAHWVRTIKDRYERPVDGNLRMSSVILDWAIEVSRVLIGLAMVCAAIRLFKGPRAQDTGDGAGYPLRLRHAPAGHLRDPLPDRDLLRGRADDCAAWVHRNGRCRPLPAERRGDRMTDTSRLPPVLALLIAVLLLLGSALTLIGALGSLRLRTFYERLHPPTLGATFGAACILIASIIYFSVLEIRPVVHELLLIAFLFLTTPMTLLLVVRAATHRDRLEGNSPIPEFDALEEETSGEQR